MARVVNRRGISSHQCALTLSAIESTLRQALTDTALESLCEASAQRAPHLRGERRGPHIRQSQHSDMAIGNVRIAPAVDTMGLCTKAWSGSLVHQITGLRQF